MEQYNNIELSVVMPCLNEEDTLEICIRKAQKAMTNSNILGEIIVADNGSTDRSLKIAQQNNAKIVNVQERGYGNALKGGISAAKGKYVIMGDADDSYDFLEIPKFVNKLREGYDLVQGCRLPGGGGVVRKGAMPFLHRWWGNPMFSFLVRLFFHAPIHDVYCGLRGFSKQMFNRLNLFSPGMEFATEMIIKSSLFKEKIAEVPITLHPDGRKSHPPHLKTFRDGWRTLRFFFLYSPKWLYILPGVFFLILGGIGYGVVFSGSEVWGIHSLLVANLSISLGYQAILFGLLAKLFAIGQGMIPIDERVSKIFQIFSLERSLVLSFLLFIVGLILIGIPAGVWWQKGFGVLDYEKNMPWVISGVLFATLGFQSILASLFGSIIGMAKE